MYLVRHPVESLEHVYGKNVLYVCVLPDSLHSHVIVLAPFNCCVSHVRHSTQLAHPPHTPAPPPCVTRIHVVWPSFRSNTRKCLTVGRPVVAVHARVGKQSEEEIR